MYIRETKTLSISFDAMDIVIIHRLIKEQVGSVTIGKIMDDLSYVNDWYKGLMTMVCKIRCGEYVRLDHDEINVLVTLLSKAYNGDTETEKDAIKKIADAVDKIRNA